VRLDTWPAADPARRRPSVERGSFSVRAFCAEQEDASGGFSSCAALPLPWVSSSFTAFLASGPSLDFVVPACPLQIALGCSIRSRETTFKKLRLLTSPYRPWSSCDAVAYCYSVLKVRALTRSGNTESCRRTGSRVHRGAPLRLSRQAPGPSGPRPPASISISSCFGRRGWGWSPFFLIGVAPVTRSRCRFCYST
jgi:hypothetical protein